MRSWAIPLLLLSIAGCARSDIYYYTEIGGQRCFFEDLSKDSLVEGQVDPTSKRGHIVNTHNSNL